MSFLSRILNPPPPPLALLWARIVEIAREPHWYEDHAVADTVDGRFDMVALVTSIVLLRLERDDFRQETALLTERFVDDMDGSLRDIGIGDLAIGKHMGRIVGALGGRLGAYRTAFKAEDPIPLLQDALVRNVYRSDDKGAASLAPAIVALKARIDAAPADQLLAGRL